MIVGQFLTRSFYFTLMTIPVLMAAVALMLIAAGGSVAATALLLAPGAW